jgi:hypothetical protein
VEARRPKRDETGATVLKAIDIAHAEMSSMTSRKDGAVRFSVITPELTLDQRATMFGLHGINVRVMIEALDVPTEGIDKVDTEMDVKTPAQRLRAVIFVHWKESGYEENHDDFDTFYRKQMEKVITGYKSKNLPEQS